jgi:ketosteroid isomerase-like protein
MEKDLEQLGQEWAAAELHGDVSALRAMLADDFVGVGPLGFTLTKQEWLDRHASGDLVYDRLSWEDARVRLHGPAAVVIGVQVQQGRYRGRPIDGRFRATHVFIHEDGRWRLEGIHLSAMPVAS